MRKLLKKDSKWDWTTEIDDDFGKLKQKKEITEALCLAHFDPKKDNYVTTDACKTCLGASLWQKEGEVEPKQISGFRNCNSEQFCHGF